MKVISAILPHSKIVNITIGVKAGSVYETKKTNGISHLVEHLWFRTNPSVTGDDLNKLLRAGVIEMDAGTGPENTLYTAGSFSEHAEQLVEIVYHAFENKDYLSEELEKEKNIVLSELQTALENPSIFLTEKMFLPMAFKGTALERKVLGTRSAITALQESDVHAFKDRFYVPNNTVITLTGDFNAETILKLIKKTFGKLKGEKNAPALKKEFLNQKKRTQFLKWPQLKQAYLCYGYQTPGINSGDYLNLELLNIFISGGPFPTRLNQMLREELGIGYYQESFFEPGSMLGAFGVSVLGFNPRCYNQVIDVIRRIYQGVAKDGVAKDEFKRAKDILLGDFIDTLESPFAYSETLTEDELLGRCSIRKHIASLKKVSKEDVQRTAKKYFNDKFVLAVLEPEYSEFSATKCLSIKSRKMYA